LIAFHPRRKSRDRECFWVAGVQGEQEESALRPVRRHIVNYLQLVKKAVDNLIYFLYFPEKIINMKFIDNSGRNF
jgi:hypothetical protein